KENESSDKNAEKQLATAAETAAAADLKLNMLNRHDSDVVNAINNEIREHKITDLIIAVDYERGFSSSFIYNLYNGYLTNDNTNLLVYHSVQPVATIQAYHVLIPRNAHREAGFFKCLQKVW